MTGKETSMSDSSRTPIIGRVDFTMMYAAHDAFSRDLRRLTEACAAGEAMSAPVRACWVTFKNQLHIHHTAEDVALWPPLRAKLTSASEEAVLDEMEIEHGELEPLLERIDTSLGAGDPVTVADTVRALTTGLTAHMRHEEEAALPLVATHLGPDGWRAFAGHFRKTQGLRGAPEFFPWLLDDASEATQTRVLKLLPPPVRLLYRRVWAPRYERRSRRTT